MHGTCCSWPLTPLLPPLIPTASATQASWERRCSSTRLLYLRSAQPLYLRSAPVCHRCQLRHHTLYLRSAQPLYLRSAPAWHRCQLRHHTQPRKHTSTRHRSPDPEHETLHQPELVTVPLPDLSGSNASGPESLLEQRALAASRMVLKADKRMDPRILRLLHGKQALRVDVCDQILSRSETLVYGNGLTGFAQPHRQTSCW